jgi:WD40 repeat protein
MHYLRLLFLQDYVLSVAVSHEAQYIVSGSKDRGVQFWDARTAQVQLTLQGHKNSGWSCTCKTAMMSSNRKPSGSYFN